MTIPNQDGAELPAGTCPTLEETSLRRWADEIERDSPKLMLDTLKQLVTLDLALVAGSVAFFQNLTPFPRVFMLVMLALSLLIALYGLMPIRFLGSVYVYDDIRQNREYMQSHRERLVWNSAVCLALAVAFACIGVISQPTVPPAAPASLNR